MLRPIEIMFGTTPDMTPMECHSAMIAYHNRNKSKEQKNATKQRKRPTYSHT